MRIDMCHREIWHYISRLFLHPCPEDVKIKDAKTRIEYIPCMQCSLKNVNSTPTMTDKTQITSTDDLETRRGQLPDSGVLAYH